MRGSVVVGGLTEMESGKLFRVLGQIGRAAQLLLWTIRSGRP